MNSNLILDIGAFKGEDAEYYLRKGFEVISVEANPYFADLAIVRNIEAARSQRYLVINAALSDKEGNADFFVHEHSDWSSLIKNNRFTEGTYKTVRVATLSPEYLFRAYGTPYYVKIDIEGSDALVLDVVCKLADKPRYVSYELGSSTKDYSKKLFSAGYDKFALVPQSKLPGITLVAPAKEGRYADYKFTLHHSGPFGREVPAEWVSHDRLLHLMSELDHSAGVREWWDVHAALAPKAARKNSGILRSISKRPAGALAERALPSEARVSEIKAELSVPSSSSSSNQRHLSLLQGEIDNVARDWKRTDYYDNAEKTMDRQWETIVWPFIRWCNFDHVVDLACGHGRNTARLLEHAEKITAIDVNKENVDFCKNRFAGKSRVTVVQNDGKSLYPLDNASASLVYCFDAMVHFDSDVVRAYLSDIKRVLRVGGHAFLHHSAMTSCIDGQYRNSPGWRNFMSPQLMAHWVAKEGLSVVGQRELDWRFDGTVRDCITFIKKWK